MLPNGVAASEHQPAHSYSPPHRTMYLVPAVPTQATTGEKYPHDLTKVQQPRQVRTVLSKSLCIRSRSAL